MPRIAKELSALEVKRLKHHGGSANATFSVGGVAGLLMQITPGDGRSWVLRVSIGGKRREIGLGGQPKPSAPTPSQDADTPPLTDTGRVKTFTGKIVSLEEWRNLPEWEQRGPNGRLWCGICREWVAEDSPCPSGICGKGGKG